MKNCCLLFHLLFCDLFSGVVCATDCIDRDDIDFIIVGSGATGAVVAARLSEVPDLKVAVLEAGGEPLHVSKIPFISLQSLGTRMNWNYTTIPQTHCCQAFVNESPPQVHGKALGGTTSVNLMIYNRGNRKDYDSWKEFGNDGWGYDDLEQYLLKIEDYRVPMTREDAPYHSQGGPITVSIPPFKSVMANAFPEMAREAGYPMVDYNGKEQIGFMYPAMNIRDGERCGTYRGYLEPAMSRDNLIVEKFALVTRILFDEAHESAIGVMYENKIGEKCTLKANKEVIISAGAFNSPHLLMLSGVGPKEELDKHKISIVHELPGVGQNLQDHASMGGLMFTLNQSVGMNTARCSTPENVDLWERTKTGPMTVPFAIESIGFVVTNSSKEDPTWPNLEFFISTNNCFEIQIPFLKEFAREVIPSSDVEVSTFLPFLLRPKSRGTVTLNSTDPHDPPRIDPNILSHDDDVKIMIEAIEMIQGFGQTKALLQYGAQLFNDGKFTPCLSEGEAGTEAYRRCFVKILSSPGYHPTSTCKMGPETDVNAVVDKNLKVHGIKNLRVADASIMPNIVAAHPQVTCMVIGEKLADMIKNEL